MHQNAAGELYPMTERLKTPVWSYWEGPQPAWIQLCLESIRRHIPEVQILTPETWPEWQRTSTDISRQRPNVKSDYIRAHQLSYHGGIWIDADAIVFRDVRPIWERLEKWDFVAYRVGRPAPQICSALIASRAGGKIAAEYLAIMEKRLSTGEPLKPLMLGPRVLGMAERRTGLTCYKIPTWRVHQIHWKMRHLFREVRDDDEHELFFRYSSPYCCMLTHRALGPARNWTREKLLESRTFAGWLFRRALIESRDVDTENGRLIEQSCVQSSAIRDAS